MPSTISIQGKSLNHKNVVPIEFSIYEAPAVEEIESTKKKNKTVVKNVKTLREPGYELRFTKAGSKLSGYYTRQQLDFLRNFLNNLPQ